MRLFGSHFGPGYDLGASMDAVPGGGLGTTPSQVLSSARFDLYLRVCSQSVTVAGALGQGQSGMPVWPELPGARAGFSSEFPWRHAVYLGLSLDIESRTFAPLLPGRGIERGLPLRLCVFRLRGRGPGAAEVSLMATISADLRSANPPCDFDYQHDNLALTGSLELEETDYRIGIAMPDLHDEGIYLQGIEPWDQSTEREDLWADFAQDGEIDPRMAGTRPAAAAWVKFELAPGETREIPFALVWHEPHYQFGPLATAERQYTRHLRKRRPDNAVVWLAEQAYQTLGGGSAAYTYWMRDIADWQEAMSRRQTSPAAMAALSDLLRQEIWWDASGRLAIAGGECGRRAREALRLAPIEDLWPDLAEGLRAAADAAAE